MAAETDRPSQSNKNIEAHSSGSGIQVIGDDNIVLGRSSFYNTGTIGAINHYHSSDIIEGHLIQYLATRETGLPEYELLLPKFLCGLPFDIPIEREVEITAEDMEEGEQLLQAAIKYWGVLGTVSGDALREGFFHREGKLEKRQNGWYLMVEQKTIDILLGKLPWSVSMLKLPWMEELLRVEWA